MNLNEALPFINIFGFLILGAAMIFTQWRLGGTKVSADVISAYKDRVDQLIADNVRLQLSQTDQGKQITALQTENKNKDTKIQELTLLISGKDPSQVEYMTQMKKVGDSALEFIKRSDEREDKIFKAISNLNQK